MCLWWTVDRLLKPPSDNSSFTLFNISDSSQTQVLHVATPPLWREQKTITDVFFPSGPWRRCSTSHSRQCPGTLPAGHSQPICSLFGPACTVTLSVVGGFTGNTKAKTMAGWEDLGDEPLFFSNTERAYRGFGFAERWTVLAGALRGTSRSHRDWCLWKGGVKFLRTYSRSWRHWRQCSLDIPPRVPVRCA